VKHGASRGHQRLGKSPIPDQKTWRSADRHTIERDSTFRAEVFVNRTKDEIKNGPELDESLITDEAYRSRLGSRRRDDLSPPDASSGPG
jgi:hypothetical protein